MDLFEDKTTEKTKIPPPLSDRIRPRTLDEFVGQTHLIGEGRLLKSLLRGRDIPSLILWGPPGSGKTTLAHIRRLHEGLPESIETSAIHLDVLTNLKRINSHITNIAYPIAEQT